MSPAQSYAYGDTSLPRCSFPIPWETGVLGWARAQEQGKVSSKQCQEHGCEPYGVRMATRDQSISLFLMCPGSHVLRKGCKGCLFTGASKWIPGVPLCQHPKPEGQGLRLQLSQPCIIHPGRK